MATTESITAAHLDQPHRGLVEIIEPDHEHYARAPGDVLRVGSALAIFIVTLLAAAILRSVISGAEADVVNLTSLVPSPVASVLTSIASAVGFFGPLAVAGTLVAIRRFRVALMVLGGIVLAGLGMWAVSKALSVQVVLPANLGELRTIQYPGSQFVASSAAAITILGPWLPRFFRRIAIGLVATVAFTNIASGTYVPYEVAVAIVLGWLVGVSLLAIFGSVNRRPSGASVAEALQRAGIDLYRLEMLGRGLRGSSIYRADVQDDRAKFVKVFSEDQRDADLLVQFYRWIRLRDAADERPFSTLRRSVEHEALIALKAADEGVPTARMVAVAEVDPDGMLLCYDYVAGDTLEGLGPDAITDEMLRGTWRIAARLRQRHIAHRDLRLAHIVADEHGAPTVVDFGFGELAARQVQLRSDIAELLCSTAVEVGAERAVAIAAEVIGPDVLGDASSRIQPLALTRATRQQLKEHDGLIGQIQAEVQRVAGLDEVRYEELARIKARTVVTVVAMTIAFYALIPRLAEVSDIGATLASAKWYWAIPLVFFLLVTWVGATVGVIGSVPDRLPFFPMLAAQVSASFVDTLAPASVGGMALNTRFMQKRGVEPAVAVAGVGLNAVSGFIVHIVLLGVFILWAGSSSSSAAGNASSSLRAPDGKTTAIVVGGLMIVVMMAWALPITRRVARTRLVPLLRDAVRGLRDLGRKPRKLVALFGGSVIVTFGFYFALLCAVQAFGGGPTPAQLGVAYLAAFAVAILAPTPGGLGALEAALIAAFQRLGMTPDAAVGSVFLFRVGTFWLPVLPGWITLGFLRRRGDL